MKLELKHIAPYLPYDLKIMNHYVNEEYTYTDDVISTMGVHWKHDQMEIHNIIEHQFKLILRPLSLLTKEIQHNGDEFIPLVEIAKICFADNDAEVGWQVASKDSVFSAAGLTFSYDHKLNMFDCSDWSMMRYRNTRKLYNKLLEWHFDLFNLIDNDLAIPVQVAHRGGGKK